MMLHYAGFDLAPVALGAPDAQHAHICVNLDHAQAVGFDQAQARNQDQVKQ